MFVGLIIPYFTDVGLPEPRLELSKSKVIVVFGLEKVADSTRPYRVDPVPSIILIEMSVFSLTFLTISKPFEEFVTRFKNEDYMHYGR